MKKKLVLMALLSVCSVLHGAADDEWEKLHVQQLCRQRVQQLCNQLVAQFGRTLVEVQPIVAELYSFMTLENVLKHEINCLEGVKRACKELQDPEIVKVRTKIEKFVGKVEMIEECEQRTDEYGQRSASLFRYHLSMLLCGLPVDDGIEYKARFGGKILAEDPELAAAMAVLKIAQDEEWREQEEARNAAQIEKASTELLNGGRLGSAEGGEEFYG